MVSPNSTTMVSPNSTRKSQQKQGKKKQRQQQPSPAKRRRVQQKDQKEKNSKIREPKLKRRRVANDLAQPKTGSGQISPEVSRYLRKEMGEMINELKNSVSMILQGFQSEIRSMIQDNLRTVHLQRPNSEDECVSICTSLSNSE